MKYSSALRAIVAFALALPTLAPARPRYTDAAACLASLTTVGPAAADSPGTEDLNALLGLTRAHLAGLSADDPARPRAARLQAEIEQIAAHPNYETKKGFGATDVIKGREAILAYADRGAAVATEIDGGALERQGQYKFGLGRLFGRSLVPLVATGVFGLIFNHVLHTDELSMWYVVPAVPFGMSYGLIMASQIDHLIGRWRAYFNPARRRAWLSRRDKEPLSAHFDTFKDPAPVYTEFAFDTRVATAELEQMRRDPRHAAVTLANGTRDLPRESTRIFIKNILFVDPQTDEAYAIVNVRGAHRGRASGADAPTVVPGAAPTAETPAASPQDPPSKQSKARTKKRGKSRYRPVSRNSKRAKRRAAKRRPPGPR